MDEIFHLTLTADRFDRLGLGLLGEIVGTELLCKTVDAAQRIDHFAAAALKERVARRADFDLDFGNCAARFPGGPATAVDLARHVLGVDFFLHGSPSGLPHTLGPAGGAKTAPGPTFYHPFP